MIKSYHVFVLFQLSSFLFIASSFAEVDYKSRRIFSGGCNTTYMQKTFVKGWKSYISLHNSDISDVVESSMDDYNFTFSIYDLMSDSMEPVYFYEGENLFYTENYKEYFVVEPSSSFKNYILEFVSPYQCMQVFYSIYYENDKSPICNFHSKRKPIENEEYQADGIFTLNCFDDNEVYVLPFSDEYNVTWYKDCSEIGENEKVYGLSESKISGKRLDLNLKDNSKDGVYFCKLSRNNVSMVTRILNITYVPNLFSVETTNEFIHEPRSCAYTKQVKATNDKSIVLNYSFNVSDIAFDVFWAKKDDTSYSDNVLCHNERDLLFEDWYREYLQDNYPGNNYPQNFPSNLKDYFSKEFKDYLAEKHKDDKYYINYKNYKCTLERVKNKESNSIQLTSTFLIKNVTDESYGDYYIEVLNAKGYDLGPGALCSVTIVRD